MNIIRQLFEIILNKRAPENIDYNISAVCVLCFLSFVQTFLALNVITQLSQPTFYALVLVGAQVIAYALLLKTHKKENRLVQTLTALIGVGVILQIPTFIFSLVPAFNLMSLIIQIYAFVISIRILKASFSCQTYLAVIIYFSVSFFALALLFILIPSAMDEYLLYIEIITAAAEQTTS